MPGALISALISCNGGKDSVLALLRARASGIEPAALLATYDEASNRIPIHDIPLEWIRWHAEALEIPLRTVPLPWPCNNQEYLRRVGAAVEEATVEGIDTIIFGDISLVEIRTFREKALADTGLTPLFPLWGEDPGKLAYDIIDAGIHATVTAVDERRLSADMIGRQFDSSLLAELPRDIDPCGENGEFHTVVWLPRTW